MDVTELLAQAVAVQASDLHLAAGEVPMLRVDGELRRLEQPPLASTALRNGLVQLLERAGHSAPDTTQELDVALELPGLGRFRLNLYEQLNGPAACVRLIPSRIPTLGELGLEDVYRLIAQCGSGLVLVGGPTGSGKSTSLAALVDQLNRQRPLHIITLEDPIEVVHSGQRSLVSQREIGPHSRDFAQGLRSALRQDPDVIMIGELRDLESIRLALRAAETGHLVLATVHTRTAVSSIDRLVEVFAAEEKALVRAMLAESLRVVMSQQLLKRIGGGRVAAREVLVVTPAVRNLIREGRLAQLHSAMQSGAAVGMRTLDAALQRLLAQGLIGSEQIQVCSSA